jgi:hypothetical protein
MLYTHAIIWKPSDEITAEREGYRQIEDAAEAVEWYRWYVGMWSPEMIARCRKELGGHDLLCWCKPTAPCHADILLEIANAP